MDKPKKFNRGEIMDEKSKQVFHRHFNGLNEIFENTQNTTRKETYAYALCELTDLYADLNGISYDAAAAELHEGADFDED